MSNCGEIALAKSPCNVAHKGSNARGVMGGPQGRASRAGNKCGPQGRATRADGYMCHNEQRRKGVRPRRARPPEPHEREALAGEEEEEEEEKEMVESNSRRGIPMPCSLSFLANVSFIASKAMRYALRSCSLARDIK